MAAIQNSNTFVQNDSFNYMHFKITLITLDSVISHAYRLCVEKRGPTRIKMHSIFMVWISASQPVVTRKADRWWVKTISFYKINWNESL